MRGIKIYLIVVTLLLVGALGFGVYVWYVIQKMHSSSEPMPVEILETTPTIEDERS